MNGKIVDRPDLENLYVNSEFGSSLGTEQQKEQSIFVTDQAILFDENGTSMNVVSSLSLGALLNLNETVFEVNGGLAVG